MIKIPADHKIHTAELLTGAKTTSCEKVTLEVTTVTAVTKIAWEKTEKRAKHRLMV